MRTVRTAPVSPEGSVQVVGVLGDTVLDEVDVRVADLSALGFTGEAGKTATVLGPGGPVVLVGLGDTADTDAIRRAAGAAARIVPPDSVIATSLHTVDIDGALDATVIGLAAGGYRFEGYRSGDSPPEADVVLVGPVDQPSLDRAIVVAEQVGRCRDWINLPSLDASPEILAAQMKDDLESAGFSVEVWNETRIEDERLGCFLGVAAGSTRPPRLVIGRYRPEGAGSHLALVGKGITFDSGGLSIKPAEGMETMKYDMAGGAAVAAGAAAVGRLGVSAAVTVIVPLTDNMPSGSATRPGDVLTARNGKTIEVLNTDAEGRLILADGLCLAVEESPDLILDVATLTGAARVALGAHIAALFASGDETAAAVAGAAGRAGERVWQMPLPADYRPGIDSAVADMKNTGGRYGGAINAALLLAEFVGETPWAHLDIAGPGWLFEDGPFGKKGGASGFGVQTIVALASEMESTPPSSI